MVDANDMAEDIASTMASLPSLSDVEDDEEIKRPLRLFRDDRRGERGVAVGALFGLRPDALEEVCETAEELVDLRLAQDRQSITVGHVRIRGDGRVMEIRVDEKFRP